MIKNISLLILSNFFVFIVLLILYFISGFLNGYGANDNSIRAAWILFVVFIIAHLSVNILLLAKQKRTLEFYIITTFEILILWLTTAWYYR
jgi:hypothetical protein